MMMMMIDTLLISEGKFRYPVATLKTDNRACIKSLFFKVQVLCKHIVQKEVTLLSYVFLRSQKRCRCLYHVVYAAFCFNTWKTNVVIFNG